MIRLSKKIWQDDGPDIKDIKYMHLQVPEECPIDSDLIQFGEIELDNWSSSSRAHAQAQ